MPWPLPRPRATSSVASSRRTRRPGARRPRSAGMRPTSTRPSRTHPARGIRINTWQWDFGDGTRSGGATPGPHRYSNASVYQVSLILRDANGKESRALAQVQVVPTQTRSGESVGDPTAGLTAGFDLSGILQPVAVTLLTC